MEQIASARARIAVHGETGTGAATRLLAAGYELVAQDARADLHVIDLRGGAVTARAARQTAAQLRRASPECGIVYLAAPNMPAVERAHLRRSGDLAFDDGDRSGLVRICRQRLRIRNVAEEAGERLKSVAALTRLSEFPPIETSAAPPSVLVAGVAGPLALAAISAASGAAERCEAALSAAQAMHALESGLYDCAVFLPKAAGDPLLGLARTMRRHRRLQDVPVIVGGGDRTGAFAFEAASNAEPMPAAHFDADLPARLVLLTRRARLMGAMRRFLSHCAGEGVRDRICGAFTPSFFGQHAERTFARADHTGRAVSLVGVRLASPVADDQDIGGVRVLTEAARLINRVTRAEDCVGRIASDTFVVLMSATARAGAEGAAQRIEGVVANTMFRTRAGRKLFAVAAATAAIERAPGTHVEEALAAVLGALKGTTPRTAER